MTVRAHLRSHGRMDTFLRPEPDDEPAGATERDRRDEAGGGTPWERGDTLLGWVAALLIVFGPLAIWGTGVVLTAGAVPSEVAEGQCEGIGFGCQLSPRDGILLSGGFIGLFVVPVATLVAVVVGWRGPVRERLGRVTTVLVVFALVVAVLGAVQASSPPNV